MSLFRSGAPVQTNGFNEMEGFATEGAKAVLDYAFNTINLREVLSWTYRGNLLSRRVMERIGMVYNSDEDFNHPSLAKNTLLATMCFIELAPRLNDY